MVEHRMSGTGRGLRLPSAQVLLLTCVLVGSGCARSKAREYELNGQVLAVDQARQEVTISHGDIPRFMPAMTMAFKVRDRRLLNGRVPGEVVKAILVVEEADAHLRTLERTGFAPVTASALPRRASDILMPGQPVADAVFLDENGARRRISEWRGSVLAVTFMYTRCPLPNFCPLMDRQFKAVQDRVRADPELLGSVRLLSVSIDPGHDSPAVLARHAAALRSDPAIWHFLTGTGSEMEKFTSQFGVSIVPGDPRDDEIVHNLRTAVLDSDGRLAAILNGNEWTAADVVTGLRNARAGR